MRGDDGADEGLVVEDRTGMVVIGAGIVGCSAAAHLTGLGWRDVVVLDQGPLSHLPFGGRAGSLSGVGRVRGRYAMETFTEPKTIIVSVG